MSDLGWATFTEDEWETFTEDEWAAFLATGEIMTTRAIGTTFGYSGGTDVIAGVFSLSVPDIEVADINVTTYDITDNAHHYASGLIEGGEVELGVIYTPAKFAVLYDDLGDTSEFTITFADGSTLEITGYIKSIGTEMPDADDDEVMRNTISIKVSGKPVFTAA